MLANYRVARREVVVKELGVFNLLERYFFLKKQKIE